MEVFGKYQISWRESIFVSVFIIGIITLPFILDNILIIPITISVFLLVAYLALVDFRIPFQHIIYLLIALAILAPPLQISSSLPSVRIEEIVIYAFFPLILIMNLDKLTLSEAAKSFVKLYCGFLFLVLASTLYGYFILDVPASVRDLFEVFTYSKYLLIFLTLHTFQLATEKVPHILYFILFTVLISGIIGLLQYFGVFNLDAITGPYYLQDRIHIISDRLTGTYKNPNTYSAILVSAHLIALGLFFFHQRKERKTLLLLCVAMLAILILFAGSRTMIAAYLLVTVIMILIGASTAGYNKFQIVTLISVLGISFLIAVSMISYSIIVRLESGLDIFSDESFAMRMLAWYLNFQLFLESPIFGWGAAKAIHTTVVDNEFILILRRYGVIGLLAFLSLYLHPLITAYKNLKADTKIMMLFSSVIFTIIITFLLAGLTNTLFHNMQVMDLWIIILSLYYISLGHSEFSESDPDKIALKDRL